MKNKPQILYIHGGMTFKNRKDYLHFLKTRTVSLGKSKRWAEGYLDKEIGKIMQSMTNGKFISRDIFLS